MKPQWHTWWPPACVKSWFHRPLWIPNAGGNGTRGMTSQCSDGRPAVMLAGPGLVPCFIAQAKLWVWDESEHFVQAVLYSSVWYVQLTEPFGSSCDSSDLYLGSVWFKSRLGRWLLWMKFPVGFLSTLRHIPDLILRLLYSCFVCSSSLKMEAMCSLESLVDFQRTGWRYISEDGTFVCDMTPEKRSSGARRDGCCSATARWTPVTSWEPVTTRRASE
jgi:hypothetical protein